MSSLESTDASKELLVDPCWPTKGRRQVRLSCKSRRRTLTQASDMARLLRAQQGL